MDWNCDRSSMQKEKFFLYIPFDQEISQPFLDKLGKDLPILPCVYFKKIEEINEGNFNRNYP